jgi:hypothetical protein
VHLGFHRPGDDLRRSAVPGEVVWSLSTSWLPRAWLGAGGDVAPLVPSSPGMLVPVVVLGYAGVIPVSSLGLQLLRPREHCLTMP